jgi:hypothetical protein
MLTLFSIPKPFRGRIAIIQRNAIQSWLQLRPACEIILFGDDEGTAEVAARYGIWHVPEVARNEHGTPLINSLFELAQAIASHRLLAYVNADIILTSDFLKAVHRVWLRKFLLVGQRWDLDLTELLDYDDPTWESRLRSTVAERGSLHLQWGIDYFVFTQGLWGEIPPFAIGRTAWDNWLIYRARSLGAPVVDATQVITAVHQNHDYAHHSQGKTGVWKGPEAQRNLELAGGYRHVFTLLDATWLLTPRGLWPALSAEHCRRHLETLLVLFPHPGFRVRVVRRLLRLRLALDDWLSRRNKLAPAASQVEGREIE